MSRPLPNSVVQPSSYIINPKARVPPSWQALDRLEMARFTRRYPQLLDPLLKQMLGMVAVRFPNPNPPSPTAAAGPAAEADAVEQTLG